MAWSKIKSFLNKEIHLEENGSEVEKKGQSRAAEMLEEERFQEFLGQCKDSRTFDVTDEAEIEKRYHVYLIMPEVTNTLKELVQQEESMDMLGYQPTKEELQNIENELKRRVFEDLDFEYVAVLRQSQERYINGPERIKKKKEELEAMGGRTELSRKSARLSGEIDDKRTDVSRSKRDIAEVGAAKEAVEFVKTMEAKLSPAEQALVKEAEAVFKACGKSLTEMEGIQQKLMAADAKSPARGKVKIPDVTSLKLEIDNLQDLGKKDAKGLLIKLADFSPASKLAEFKQKQQQACNQELVILSGLALAQEERDPAIEASIKTFEAINGEINSITIDVGLDRGALELHEDFERVTILKQDYAHLKADPTDAEGLMRMKETVESMRTVAGQKLANQLAEDLDRLQAMQQELGSEGISREAIMRVAEYSNKGILGKMLARARHPLTNQNPEVQAQKKLQAEKEFLGRLERRKQSVVDEIRDIDDVQTELGRIETEYEDAKANVFLSMESVRAVFKSVRDLAEQDLAKKLKSEKLQDVLASKELSEKLVLARKNRPELYGEMTEDDDAEAALYNLLDFDEEHDGTVTAIRETKITVRNLSENLEAILAKRVTQAARKALEQWKPVKGESLSYQNMAKQMQKFESGLGSVAQSKEYKNVRLKALEGLLKGNILPNGKHLALRLMLNNIREEGSWDLDYLEGDEAEPTAMAA